MPHTHKGYNAGEGYRGVKHSADVGGVTVYRKGMSADEMKEKLRQMDAAREEMAKKMYKKSNHK